MNLNTISILLNIWKDFLINSYNRNVDSVTGFK